MYRNVYPRILYFQSMYVLLHGLITKSFHGMSYPNTNAVKTNYILKVLTNVQRVVR